jgi:hypothetical protein
MNKFKVGDKITAYSFHKIYKGIVVRVEGAMVYLDVCGAEFVYHYKQCRKLIPKPKPEEFWVTVLKNGTMLINHTESAYQYLTDVINVTRHFKVRKVK